MLVIETFLALGADDAEDTWLERASGLTGDELSENLPRYVPEAEGQDIPPSAVSQYLGQQYGDTAMLLCDQWQDVHDEMVWFEGYNEENDLWPEDNEDDNAYKERLDSHFKALTEEDETAGKGNAFNQIWDNTGIVAVTSYAAAALSYYQRDMTPIPRMIVDESDIVTYLTDDNGKPILDEKGNQKKNIDFKTYEYYSAVKCNRPEVGEIGDWQDGISDYKDPEHYCYDIADLNADMGQEWIALYTVKSQDKGDPILADSLTLQYGSNKTPEGCTKGLHLASHTIFWKCSKGDIYMKQREREDSF